MSTTQSDDQPGRGAVHETRGGSRAAERQKLVDMLERGVETQGLDGRLLRTREVAVLFEVSERAVTDWATKGRIPSIRTPGGHRRYPAVDIARLVLGGTGSL